MLDFFFLFTVALFPASVEPETPVDIEDPLKVLLEEDPADFGSQDPESTPDIPTLLPPSSMVNEQSLQKGAVSPTETVAIVQTRLGEVVLRFFPEEAPKTVENFTGLANNKYYDGIVFHRVIDGFMVQGGDPTGTGMGGESLWGGKFEDEFSDSVSNSRGSISMANAGPGTNGSQFFINTVDNTFLDNRHSVFGEVIAGMETVDAIVSTTTDASDRPVEEIKMDSVLIMTYQEYLDR